MTQESIARPAGILHDMRNILSVVSLNSSLLSMSKPADHSTLVAGITQASEYLESLINDLESLTMYSAHGVRPADLDATLEQVASFARAMHPNVHFLLPTRTGLSLRIEQTQLLRCLLNLAVNAAEAATRGSSQECSVEFEIAQSANHLTIKVIDSGDGFPQADPTNAFDAFVSQRTNSPGHSGLGLYVVRSIVEQAGGSVTAAREGSKTEVRIALPAHIERDY